MIKFLVQQYWVNEENRYRYTIVEADVTVVPTRQVINLLTNESYTETKVYLGGVVNHDHVCETLEEAKNYVDQKVKDDVQWVKEELRRVTQEYDGLKADYPHLFLDETIPKLCQCD